MSNFRVKNPTIPKLEKLAMLVHNFIYYERVWLDNGGFENRKMMEGCKSDLKKWDLENVEPIKKDESCGTEQ